MRFRVTLFDVSAALLVVVAIALPPRTPRVTATYPPIDAELGARIGELQARLIAVPGDGAAAEELADLLSQAGYMDWALRVAGAAAQHEGSPTLWRALRAVSSAHADRIELTEAFAWAQRALEACRTSAKDCLGHEQVRLGVYLDQLDAGLKSNIDPRLDPEAFRDAIARAGLRKVRIKGPRGPGGPGAGEEAPPGGGVGVPPRRGPPGPDVPPGGAPPPPPPP
jgi:hypothetical protein